MRNRYRVPGRDDGQPAQPVHESLQHAYQAPPAPHRPAPPPVRTHVPPPPAPRHQPAAHVDNQPQPEAQQYQTPYGQATVGKNSGRYLGSLTDGDTWLLLSTNSTAVSQDDISLVMTHLKKY
jgi:hypothetical protein